MPLPKRTRDKSTSALLSSATNPVTAPAVASAVEQFKAVAPAAAAGATAAAATADPDAGALNPSDPERRAVRRRSGIAVEKRPGHRMNEERERRHMHGLSNVWQLFCVFCVQLIEEP